MKKRRSVKFLRYMRNLFFLLLISASSVGAKGVHPQGAQETFSVKNRTVESIFEQIKNQSGYNFFYNTAMLDVKRNITLTSPCGTLDEILTQVLGENMYQIKDNYILISERKITVPDDVQKVTIKGIVKDRSGVALPGVSVLLKGTALGVATDIKGEFSLTIPAQDTIVLRFSFIGMKMKDVPYKKQEKYMLVVLEDDVEEMEEVVVTGYQEVKKSRMTGAVEVMTAKDIANKGYTSLDQALKGTLAGVSVMNTSGRPGAQAQIRIRGLNSLSGNMDPIWIVDGMPLQGDVPSVASGSTDLQNTILTSGIGNITPDDIESITVLKDAAATAIYGSRAANGVIVIKTKRGRVGESFFNIQSTISIDEAPKNKLKMMNTAEKIAYERGIYVDFPQIATKGRISQLLRNVDEGKILVADADAEIEKLSKINTNWFDEIFDIAISHNHVATMSGGSETTQYYASMNYNSEEGVMPNNKYNRLGATLKLTHDFNKYLRVYFDVNSTIRNDKSSASIVDPLQYATFANTYEQPYDENGNYAYDRSYFPTLSSVKDGYKYDFNILEDLNANTRKTKYMSSAFNLKLELKLYDGLMYSFLATMSSTSSSTKKALAPGTYSSKASSWANGFYTEGEIPDYMNQGSLTESNDRAESWTIRNQIEYTHLFKDAHYVNLLIGQEASDKQTSGFFNYSPEYDPSKEIIGFPDIKGIDGSKLKVDKLGSTSTGQDRSVSFFFVGSYVYRDKYVLSGSFRMDGADIIGTANRFSPLWNVSGKWNMHEENFIGSLGFVDVLALRASYGFTGSIDRNAYPFTLLTYTSGVRYDGELIPTSVQPGNPSVKWQKKEERSIGLDFAFFKQRINGTVNYYLNDVRDLLDYQTLPYSSGRSDIKANVASLRNSGWEFSLNTVNVDYNNFRWTTKFDIAINKNRVTKTYYTSVADLPGSISLGSKYYVEGYSSDSWYGYKFAGVDPLTGHTLVYVSGKDKYGNQMGHAQADGRYVIDADQIAPTEALQFLGEGYPPITGGFGTTVAYKRLSLGAQFTFATGHKIRSYRTSGRTGVSSSNYNQFRSEINRWRNPGDITDIPGYVTSSSGNAYDNYIFDDYFEDGSYVKCSLVSLGYNLSPNLCRLLKLNSLRLNFNMHNAFTWTKYKGIDPETQGAFGYPSARKYMFTLNIGI